MTAYKLNARVLYLNLSNQILNLLTITLAYFCTFEPATGTVYDLVQQVDNCYQN